MSAAPPNSRGRTTVHNRYEVGDPQTEELIDAYRTWQVAVDCARREAECRGYMIEVFDRMARRGHWERWRVESTGVVCFRGLRA